MIHLIVNHNDNFINWKLVQIFGQWRLAEEILNGNSVIEKVSIIHYYRSKEYNIFV